jgi:calcium-dependent protein kinase
MKCVDLDGNGFIDYNEFLTATINRDKILSQKNLELAFQAFDKDGSGKINIDEIMQIFNNKDINDKSVFEKIVKEADENGDGEISYEEFRDLMTKFFA